MAGLSIGSCVQAQTPEKKCVPAKKQELTFNSSKEKEQKIRELENRLKVNALDETYPFADLQKEKKELELVKQATINPVSH